MARKLSAELRIDVKTLNVKALDDLASKLAGLEQHASRGVTSAAANVNASTRAAQQSASALERWQIRTQITSAQMAQKSAAAAVKEAAQKAAAEEKAADRIAKAATRAGAAKERAETRAAAAERKRGIVLDPVAREVKRFQDLEIRRNAREAARKQLGMDAPGSFLSGHGFTSRTRAAIGALRDLTVAGYGVHAAIAGVEKLTEPFREFQTLSAQTRNKGQFNDAEMKQIEALSRTMGKTTQFSATQSMGAAVELAAAGVKPGEMAKALPSTLRFSQASGLGTEQSAGLLVETGAQLGLGTDQFERIGDAITKAANVSTIAVSDVAESLKYVGPLARDAGLGLEFTAGTIALLGENGLKGSMGGTAMRQILSSLVHQSKLAKKELAKTGLTEKDMAAGIGSPQKLQALFAKISGTLDKKGFSQAQKLEFNKLVFGQEGMTAASILERAAVDKSAKGWELYAGQVNDAKGAMSDAANVIGGTLDGRLKAMKARFEEASIVLSESYLPSMERAIGLMGRLGTAVGKNPWIADATLLIGGAALAGSAATALGTALAGEGALAAVTAAGATLGGTLMAAMAAGIAGYKIGQVIGDAIGLKSLEDQERAGSGYRGMEKGAVEPLLPGAITNDPSDKRPLRNDRLDDLRAWNASQQSGTAAPMAASIEISIAHDGKPRVNKITNNDSRLSIGANVQR